MTVVFIPIRKVDGVPSSSEAVQVCSEKDQTLVTLSILGRTLTVEASALQAAIRDCSPSQWEDHVTRSIR
jgi:hypothetical protein